MQNLSDKLISLVVQRQVGNPQLVDFYEGFVNSVKPTFVPRQSVILPHLDEKKTRKTTLCVHEMIVHGASGAGTHLKVGVTVPSERGAPIRRVFFGRAPPLFWL